MPTAGWDGVAILVSAVGGLRTIAYSRPMVVLGLVSMDALKGFALA